MRMFVSKKSGQLKHALISLYCFQPMSDIGLSFFQAWQLLVQADALLWRIVWLSLAVSGLATLLGFLMGTVAGAWLATHRFAGRAAVLVLLHAMLALPSVVVGLLVYLLLSRSGPLGHLGWLYSFKAMVIAQTILVLPIVAAWVRQTVEDVENAHGEQLKSLGAGSSLRALLCVFNERSVMLTLLLAAFGRAISEVGAVMIVGGNIDGFTRVMTTAITLEASKGEVAMALALGIVLIWVVLVLNAAVAWIKSRSSSTTVRGAV
jgi:tungstate transport system permease protein